ncbi:hypothetical protein V502_01874 [Pseudogymnoascus sp. VKM F-4520 (FW-2644)]|nr:hypothetical protein V502_01874 [Pseudogymnoascus sp. VKM F-4520 (FW-2644)]
MSESQKHDGPQVTEYLVPGIDVGKVDHVLVEKEGTFAPKVDIASFGGGEVGSWRRKTNADRSYRWTLSGRPASDDAKRITRAIWRWDANPRAVAELPRRYRVGLAVSPVVDGNFSIELKLRARLQHMTAENVRSVVKTRFGFKKKALDPHISEIPSLIKKADLKSSAKGLFAKAIGPENQSSLRAEAELGGCGQPGFDILESGTIEGGGSARGASDRDEEDDDDDDDIYLRPAGPQQSWVP